MKTENVGQAVLETWDVEEVAEAFERDEIVLIDVRTVQEYGFEHIGGALLLPLPFFEARRLPGQSEKRIVFHCGSGVRSEKVARLCIEAGMDRVAHLEGGFGAWKAAKKRYVGTDMATGAPKVVNG
ncbi:MAG: rhodanese-like domain-containing protein [Roseovarius sp.]|uniref:rhodanese-like domain-containing protein n=1 Tax=Roseovarius sp. TaxID=1486281 RepID=UPI0032ECC609